MTRKHPENDNPNVLCVHELAGSGCCKERSDGIAIATLCVNRVQSQSPFSTVLIYLDFLNNYFIPPTQIGMLAAAIGADFAEFDGGVLFGAVFAIGDGGNGFYLKSTAAKKVGAIGVPVPTIDQLIVDDG